MRSLCADADYPSRCPSFLPLQASSLSTSTALPALANQIAEASGKLKDIFGPDATTKQEVESWLSKIDADQVGDFKVGKVRAMAQEVLFN